MIEQWQAVPGIDDRYEVSNTGLVRSWAIGGPWGKKRMQSPRILSQVLSGTGYPCVSVPGNGTWRLMPVHRMVAMAFLGMPQNGYEVAHNDGDRTNARLDNLRWATRSSNHADKRIHGTDHRGERAPAARLTNEQAAEVLIRLTGGESGASIARTMGTSQSAVSRIKLQQSYTEAAALVAALEEAP